MSEDSSSFSPSLIGLVPVNWKQLPLGDVCRFGGGDIQTGPFGSQLHASDYVPIGIPSVMPQNIGDNKIIEDGIVRITPADAQRLNRYLLKPGDIVYSRRGDVERRALVREHEDGWLCGTGCLRVRLGSGYADPLYTSFYLSHPEVRAWIVRHAVGATMPNLNTSILSALPFVLPPLETQRAIAHILGTLDDKIELNRRTNETLEAMAKAMFKSWFVDFDPVRAKAEGRQPQGMDAETAALFPDSFENSELGEVPRGWKVSTIGQEVEVMGGGTPSTKEPTFWNGDINWVTPKDLSGLGDPILLNSERKITNAGLAAITSGLLPAGTVLLSSRAPVGYLAVSEIPVAINQGFIAMKCTRNLPTWYVFHWAKQNMDAIKGRANGTTFLEVSKSNFRPMPVLTPSSSVLLAFDKLVSEFYKQIANNIKESNMLSNTRDLLLPKLISGDLEIGELSSDGDLFV